MENWNPQFTMNSNIISDAGKVTLTELNHVCEFHLRVEIAIYLIWLWDCEPLILQKLCKAIH